VYKALDQVRLRLQRQADPFWKALLVRGRATLGRAPATWMDAERTVVETLLAEYPDLQHAWERADEFRTWYHSPDRATAARTLVRWEQAVQRDGVREYQMLLGSKAMLSSWRNEVLNYFDHRYTNSYCEGKNTRTKQLIRQAYGYRNRNNLRLRILLPAA
jgi:transposase